GDRVPGMVGDTGGAGGDAAELRRVAAMIAYLKAPAQFHHGSTMPSYAFLSGTELRRLAIYLTHLRCDTPGGIVAGGSR
ncbi:MAG: hypothetical protein ABR520_06555, partial [Mycobacteriales bacterium]